MKILIKLHDESNINLESYDFVFSSSKLDKNNDKSKWNYIPYNDLEHVKINKSFWIINNKLDNKEWDVKNIDSIDIDLKYSESKNCISINSKKAEEKDMFFDEEENLLKIMNIELTRIPIISKYKEIKEYNIDVYSKDYLIFWFYTISKSLDDIKTNIIMPKEESINKYEILNKKSINEYLNIKKETGLRIINSGMEGYIALNFDNRIEKLINRNITKNNDKIINIVYKMGHCDKNAELAIDFMIENNKEINLDINELNERLIISYDNVILPKGGFTYYDVLPLLRQMYKSKRVIVDDVKTDNFGRLNIKNNNEPLFSKFIYSDFGRSFIKLSTEKEWENIFPGIVRNYYFFVKTYRMPNYRFIIRNNRKHLKKSSEFGGKLKLLWDEIIKTRKEIYLCHTNLSEKEILKRMKTHEIKTCFDPEIRTLKFDKKISKSGKIYCMDPEKNELTECNICKGESLAKKLGLNKSLNNSGKEIIVYDYDNKLSKIKESYLWEK